MSAAPTTIPAAQPAKPPFPPQAFVALGVGSILLTAMILLLVYAPVVSLMLAPTPPAVEPLGAGTIKTREREFADRLASAGNKIVTRSPFHPKVDPPPETPKIPTVYGGPTIVGVAGGAVYFNEYSGGTKRINLGETDGEITVIRIDAPWSVTLGWKGGEFVVPMLDRQPVKFDSALTVKDMLFQTTPAHNNAADATRPTPGSNRPRRN